MKNISPKCISSIVSLILFIASGLYGQNNQNKSDSKQMPGEDIQVCDSCYDKNTIDYCIYYDFKCKKFYQYDTQGNKITLTNLSTIKVRYNRLLQFKIVNINRYIYNVHFTADDIDFASEPPALFNELFLGSGNMMTSLLSQAQEANGISKELVAPVVEDDYKKFEDAFILFKEVYDSLIDMQLNANSLCDTLKCCSEIKKRTFSGIDSAYMKLRLAYFEITSKASDALKDTVELQNELSRSRANQKSDTVTIKNKLNELHVLAKNQKSFEDFWQQTAGKITDEQLMKLVLFNNNLVKYNSMYITPPIYPQGNQLQLKISFTTNDSSWAAKLSSMPLYRDSLFLDLAVKWKPFIAFSAGTFYSWGSSLLSDNYVWQPQPDTLGVIRDTSPVKLARSTQLMPPVGFAAFANVGAKFSGAFGAGLSLGAGIAMEKQPRTVYLGGLTFYIGDQRQFNVTGGAAFSKVRTLSAGFTPYVDNVTNVKPPPNIEYDSNFKRGWFLAATYTFYNYANHSNIH